MCEKKGAIMMNVCPCGDTCTIVQDQSHKLPELAERFKHTYCEGNYNRCSRRWVQEFLGVEKVPELMLPHQHDWAQQILTDSGIGRTEFRQKFPKP